jgi:hypothetical protein
MLNLPIILVGFGFVCAAILLWPPSQERNER